jgi:energy-coupling factor transporter ATP-binding protein EcfA2
MIRVDGISLPASSPLGPVAIGGSHGPHLAEFDVIVIVGPNGSGKSRLTESLTPQTKEHLQRLHLAGSHEAIDDPRTDILPQLVSRTSTELMGPFESMSAALTRASGIARIREERMILERIVRSSDGLLSPPAGVRSRELADALMDYAALESRAIAELGDRPLDLSTYDAIGQTVAGLTGTKWTAPYEVDDAAMRASEETIRPTNRSLAGQLDFKQAWERFRSQAISSEVADRLRTSCSAVDSMRDEALRMLETPIGEMPIERLPDRCEEVARDAEKHAAQCEERADRLDALLALRDRAREVLDSEPARSTCLLCEQPIDRDQLLQDLSSTGASGHDVQPIRDEARKSRDRARELRKTAGDLRQVVSERSRVTDGIRSMLKSLLGEAETFKTSLGRISGAAEAVAHSVTASRTAVDQFLPNLARALDRLVPDELVACGQDLERLLRVIHGEERSLETRSSELNRSVAAAEMEFRKLEPIRRALTEAKRVNAMDWQPDWERSEARVREKSALSDWMAVIKPMVESRSERERHVTREVIEDPEVRRRFRQLLDRVHHPLIRSLILEEERVTDGRSVVFGKNANGRGTTSQLSEGYQVLVNLAAFIAIAGHVRAGQEHKAGWILLDEPTNGLDPDNRRLVARFLGSIDREAMPRQMFITTFEREFADLLIEETRQLRSRRCLLIELAPWAGPPIRTPTVTRFG